MTTEVDHNRTVGCKRAVRFLADQPHDEGDLERAIKAAWARVDSWLSRPRDQGAEAAR